MDEDRGKDSLYKLVPSLETGKARATVTLDVLKSAFIAEGLPAQDIAERYHLSLEVVQKLIVEHKLGELRQAYMRKGMAKIQNVQLTQANKLLDIETNFKKLRLIQLENTLADFVTYYSRHGDFYKRHPHTGEILKNMDGIPMQLKIPNVSKEILQIKESVTLSEGLKKLMLQIDDIINSGRPSEVADADDDVIDLENIDHLFRRNSGES